MTATGEEVHLTAERDPELWWGMLGHGAALATVTSMEVELSEVRELSGGRLSWPIHRTEEVLAAYANAAADLPGEVSLDLALLQEDAADGSRYRSVVVDAVASAPMEALLSITRALRSIPELRGDSTSHLRPSGLFAINDDPTDPTPEHYDGGLLDALGAREVALIAATLGDDAENPFDSLESAGSAGRSPGDYGGGSRAHRGAVLDLRVAIGPTTQSARPSPRPPRACVTRWDPRSSRRRSRTSSAPRRWPQRRTRRPNRTPASAQAPGRPRRLAAVPSAAAAAALISSTTTGANTRARYSMGSASATRGAIAHSGRPAG